MAHIKFLCYQSTDSREEILKVCTIYWHGHHVCHVTWTVWIFWSLIPRRHIWLHLASEDMFKTIILWKSWVKSKKWPWPFVLKHLHIRIKLTKYTSLRPKFEYVPWNFMFGHFPILDLAVKKVKINLRSSSEYSRYPLLLYIRIVNAIGQLVLDLMVLT